MISIVPRKLWPAWPISTAIWPFILPATLTVRAIWPPSRGVSRAQVQEVIDAWIRPEAMTLVALTPGSGNSAAQEDALRRTLAEAWPQAPSGHARAAGGENAATARAGTRLNDEVISLGEGRTLVLRPDRSLPYVSATLLFEGGDELASGLSGLDVVKTGQSPEGLASLTADVLVSSTKKRDYAAMSAYLQIGRQG